MGGHSRGYGGGGGERYHHQGGYNGHNGYGGREYRGGGGGHRDKSGGRERWSDERYSRDKWANSVGGGGYRSKSGYADDGYSDHDAGYNRGSREEDSNEREEESWALKRTMSETLKMSEKEKLVSHVVRPVAVPDLSIVLLQGSAQPENSM